jgi:erythromycin esterase-like protein
VGHAEVIASRREKIEQRTSERRETEVQHRLEEKRIAFLDNYADTLDRADKRQRFLQNLRRASDGKQSQSMAEFMRWSEAHIEALRAACDAPALERDLAVSGLWIADPAGWHH